MTRDSYIFVFLFFSAALFVGLATADKYFLSLNVERLGLTEFYFPLKVSAILGLACVFFSYASSTTNALAILTSPVFILIFFVADSIFCR